MDITNLFSIFLLRYPEGKLIKIDVNNVGVSKKSVGIAILLLQHELWYSSNIKSSILCVAIKTILLNSIVKLSHTWIIISNLTTHPPHQWVCVPSRPKLVYITMRNYFVYILIQGELLVKVEVKVKVSNPPCHYYYDSNPNHIVE